ncbi:MAG TPA: zf-HC2 domain-containing protein, partial [bacterium]|nr:zf-HC2 domain-containing protein [bacterium]
LSELVDGVLDPVRARELEEHLAGCAGCSRELAALRRVRAQMRALPVRRAPGDFYAKVMAKAEKKSVLERVTKALSVLWHLPAPAKAGVAFAASLVLVITVWVNNQPDRDLWSLGAAPSAKVAARPPSSEKVAVASDQEASPRAEEKAPAVFGGEGDVAAHTASGHAENIAAAQTPIAGAAVGPAAPAPTSVAALADRRKDEAGKDASAMPEKVAVSKAEMRSAPAKGSASGGIGFAATEEPADNAKKKTSLKEAEISDLPPPPPGASNAAGRGAAAPSTPVARATPVQPGLFATVPSGAPAPVAQGASAAPAPRAMAKPDSAGGVVATGAKSGKRAGAAAPVTAASSADAGEGAPPIEEPAVKASRAAEPAFDSMSSSGSTGSVSGGSAGGGASGTTLALGAESKRDTDKNEADDTSRAVAAPTPTPVTLHARVTVDSLSGPADVLAAASDIGATPVSTNPPALAKSGAYTIVVIDVPAGKWPALAEKLNAMGTLEVLVDPPTRRTKMRIEVLRH